MHSETSHLCPTILAIRGIPYYTAAVKFSPDAQNSTSTCQTVISTHSPHSQISVCFWCQSLPVNPIFTSRTRSRVSNLSQT